MKKLALATTFASVAAALFVAVAEANKPAAKTPARVAIAVTENGFEPESIQVRKGEPVTLVFTRKTKVTCATDVLIKIDDKTSIKKDLPLNAPVEIPVSFPRSGKLRYACGMDMLAGVIHVE